jgi:ubiquinone/menaquinone biosynthesis C-methylase UbiE
MKTHWEEVYATKDSAACSWYQPSPEPSLNVIDRLDLQLETPVLDAGGGDMFLPDALVARGVRNLTVVDISEKALNHTRQRLGPHAEAIRFIAADVKDLTLAANVGLWHDRAVFHFMTDPVERAQYREVLVRALQPGGIAIVATFAPEGPDKCSGLPVQQYAPAELATFFASDLDPIETFRQTHTKPSGGEQVFSWAVLRKPEG